MKVGIESSALLVRQKTGVEHYVTELVDALVKELPNHPDLELVLYFHAGNKNSDHNLVIHYQNSFTNVTKRFYSPRRWYRLALLLMTLFDRVHLLHCPTPIIPLVKTFPTIMTFHDISLDLHDDETKRGVIGAIKRSDFIIAVSADTKNALVKYGFNEKKVSVIYEALPENFFPDLEGAKQVRKKYNLQKYILSVGTFHPRKNHEGLLSAYQVLRNKYGISQSLVLVGKKASAYDPLLVKIQELNLVENVRILDYVPTSELSGLYTGADLFVLPSFHEGFGITVLEAMACGTPVATSNVGSLPEIAADAAVYFDPYDIGMMALVINRVLGNEGLHQQLSNLGCIRIKDFSWPRTARKTIDVYQEFSQIHNK